MALAMALTRVIFNFPNMSITDHPFFFFCHWVFFGGGGAGGGGGVGGGGDIN